MLLSALKVIGVLGQLFKDKMDKQWSSDFEDQKNRLWRERNKPHYKRDMRIVDDAERKLQLLNEKMEKFLLEMLSKK